MFPKVIGYKNLSHLQRGIRAFKILTPPAFSLQKNLCQFTSAFFRETDSRFSGAGAMFFSSLQEFLDILEIPID